MKKLWPLLALLLYPPQLLAATLVVDASKGCGAPLADSAAGAPYAINVACYMAKPGDLVTLNPGTYTRFPVLRNNGGTTTPITLIGDTTWTNGQPTVIVPGGGFSGRWKDYRGLYIDGNIGMDTGGKNIRLQKSVITGYQYWDGADSCAILSCATPFDAGKLRKIAQDGLGVPGGFCAYDTIAYCTLSLGPNITSYAPWYWRNNDHLAFLGNRVTLALDNNTPGDLNSMRWMNETHNATFTDNHWLMNNQTSVNRNGWWTRDSTDGCVFTRDTIINIGTSTDNYPYASGSFGQIRNNRYVNCVIINRTGEPAIQYQGPINGDQWTGCVLASSGAQAMVINNIPGVAAITVIDHCTLYGYTNSSGYFGYTPSIFSIAGSEVSGWASKVRFTNNLLFDASPAVVPPAAAGSRKGVFWTNLIQGGDHSIPLADTLKSNWNVYSIPSYGNGLAGGNQGDHSVGWRDTLGTHISNIGTGTPWYLYRNQYDPNSYFVGTSGTRKTFACNFRDSSISSPTFDLHPTASSGFLTADSAGAAVGAYASALTDVVRPARVTTAVVSGHGSSYVSVQWTTVGDDSLAGTPVSYDVAYATFALDSLNIATAQHATVLVDSVAVPYQPNQTASATITGLALEYDEVFRTGQATYYFVIRGKDELGNYSGFGNLVQITIHSTDDTPPDHGPGELEG